MSMQFASARLVSGGDGIGVSDSSMDGDPAGSSRCPWSVVRVGSESGAMELSGNSC